MRIAFPFIVMLAAVPAAAQNSLPGLDNFTLERPRQPAPVTTPSPTPTPAPTPSASPSAPAPTPSPRNSPTPSPRASASPTPSPTASASRSATPSPTPSPSATPEAAAPVATPDAAPSTTPVAAPGDVAAAEGAPGWLAWAATALAVVAAIAAASWWWRGRRPPRRIAHQIPVQDAAEPPAPPQPEEAASSAPPVPVGPAEPPPAAQPSPGGLVTVSLRPDLALDLRPLSAGIDTLRATVEFSVEVRNTGRAPAYEVIVEAWLIGAGNDARAELQPLLYGPPVAPLTPPFDLPASASADVTGQGMAARATLPTITAGERQLFVPLIGVRASWQDGRGQATAIRAAFLIGAERADHARLAPLALDRGAKTWRTIAARRYEL